MAQKHIMPGGHTTQAFVDRLFAGNAQSQLIMKAIAQHADYYTGECIPRVRDLAMISKCSPKTVRRHLHRMAGDGLITLVERWDDEAEAGKGLNRQTTSVITLIGYAEWVAVNYLGGVIRPPKFVKRHTVEIDPDDHGPPGGPPGHFDQGGDDPPGQIDQGTPGQVDQGVGNPPGQGDQAPLDTTVSRDNEPFILNEESKISPPAPRVRKRTRGERKQDDRDDLIKALRARPGCERVVDKLLKPILLQRRFNSEDAAYTLGVIADWACTQPDNVLEGALHKVLEDREAVVFEGHITEAVHACIERLGLQKPASRPGAKPIDDGLVTIDKASKPDAFEAWYAFHAAHKPHPEARRKTCLMDLHGFIREKTLMPPAALAPAASVPTALASGVAHV